MRAALHLGAYHESVDLPEWSETQLGHLNESLGQKATNGYFTVNVGHFLAEFFQSNVGWKPVPQHLHPQVILFVLQGVAFVSLFV